MKRLTDHLSPTRRALAILVVMAGAVALPGCGDDDGTGPGSNLASIVVTAGSTTLVAIDATVQASATALDANGGAVGGVTFNWTSSDQSVATVDGSGLITAVGNGTSSISAAVNSTSGSLTVTVEQEVTTIAFAAAPSNGSVGTALSPEVQVELRDANDHAAENATDAVTLALATNPTGAFLVGTLTRTAVAGVVDFPGLMVDAAGAGFTLEATSVGLSAETDPFNLTLPSVYVARDDATVAVIDRSDNTAIALPATPNAFDVAITPDGLFAYTANPDDNSSSVIATTTNTVITSIPVGDGPPFVEITPDGSEAWVTNGDSISVITTATNTVATTIPNLSDLRDLVFTPDGSTAYVATNGGPPDSVAIIDVATRAVMEMVPVGDGLYGLDITPDGEFVYVANPGDDSVSVIATATNMVVDRVGVGDTPRVPAVTPDGMFVYVTNLFSATVSVIDVSTLMVVEAIDVDDFPEGAEVTSDGAFVYVANAAGTVSVIDASTNSVVREIITGGEPAGIAIMPAPIP